MFDHNPNLGRVWLANNNIASIDTGALDSDIINLSDNQLQQVNPDAFGDRVKYIWVTGNNVTCGDLAQALPPGAACLDDAYCRVAETSRLGDGYCNAEADPEFDTAVCFWDAGGARGLAVK